MTMNHESTVARVRAIHAVLDAAALIVAVWAEPTTPTHWEARYELGDGQSGYVARSFLDGVRAGKISGHKAQTNPGAIRFEAREAAEWPAVKAEMAERYHHGAYGPGLVLVAWDKSRNETHAY